LLYPSTDSGTVVDELIQEHPLPEYLDYLRNKLITAGFIQSA
jgi:hypothetical protein